MLLKERTYQEIKEEKQKREFSILEEELTKLRTSGRLVVKEQQRLRKLLEEQRDTIKNLIIVIDYIERRICADKEDQTTMTAPSLLTEVEVLRRRLVEMEGKDEELIRMAEQCRELDRRLAKETHHCRGLKGEVDRLNSRIGDLDRIEETLGRSKQDCSVLMSSLQREREVGEMLSDELVALRLRVKELEAIEGRLEKSEMAVRQDLAKLRSLTVALVEDRKSMAERLRQAEEKVKSRRNDSENLVSMTERLREEKQQEDLEEKLKSIIKEKEDLQYRLEAEEERNRELQSKITTMKRKLNVFDNRKEKEEKSRYSNTAYSCQTEDNKVKELSQELEMLRRRVQDKELLEGELLKLEEDFESLERKLDAERRRTEALTEELESSKKELCRYKQAEKQDVNQEHVLLCHLQKEQVKSRLLAREVDTLKEKLQKMTVTEKSISKVQTDQSLLQRKLVQQEIKNKELAREMEDLRSELEGYRTADASRHISRNHQTLREEEDPNHNTEVSNRRRSLVDTENNINQSKSQSETVNGEVMMLTHTSGQPLHIKVTPHNMLSTATLEISSPSGDAAAPYTSTAIIPAGGTPPKQRITIIQNSKTPSSSPDRTVSPLNGASQALGPNSPRSATPDNNNPPIQIVTVRTCSPEPTDATNQATFCRTPERSNSWQHQKSNDMSPSIVATEDSKIHIHVGSTYANGVNGGSPQPVGPYFLRHEQRTQIIANNSHVKGVGKITSSITISPANVATAHSNVTVSGICD